MNTKNNTLTSGMGIALRSIKLLLAVVGLGLGMTLSSTASINIVSYSFGGLPPSITPTTVYPDVTANNISLGSGVTSFLGVSNQFFLQPVNGDGSLTQAKSLNTYLQFTVTPDAGFTMNLLALSFQADYGWSGARFAVLTSLDGFTSAIDDEAVALQQLTLTGYSINLSGPTYQNLTAPVTFRIYDYNPATSGGVGPDIGFSNLLLTGTVNAVPEPTTLAMLGIGGLAMLGLRRRQA
jgi:hypothetical protein